MICALRLRFVRLATLENNAGLTASTGLHFGNSQF
jgi:hypothetical protein